MRDTIIFDGEGVVIDSEKLWDRGQEEFLRRRGIRYDRGKIKPLLAGRSMVEGVHILQREYHFSGDVDSLARERVEIVRVLFRNEAAFVPGFEEFYGRVHQLFKICMATMMPKDLLALVVERLNLHALFGEYIYSAESNDLPGKPAPDLFLFAANQLGSTSATCIVIEDSPNGIEAARRAGMLCIGIATTFETNKLMGADIVVTSFEEIEFSGNNSPHKKR
jgi:beta-phosphoglucomutase-like phosphatase (HAD superfamily)